jgi:hypothetical protein
MESEAYTLTTYERLPIESAMTRGAMPHLRRAILNYVQGGLVRDKRIAMELRNLANLLASFLERLDAGQRSDSRNDSSGPDDPLLG